MSSGRRQSSEELGIQVEERMWPPTWSGVFELALWETLGRVSCLT
jgi:hypothetical protein